MTCPPLQTVAAWTLSDLEETDAELFEDHYFSCDVCLERAVRTQRLVAQLDASLPPVVTSERRHRLESAGPIQIVEVRSGERASVRLGTRAGTDLALWVMHASLADAARVDLEARGPDGALFFALKDVPFDAGGGQVVLACQTHYRTLGVSEMHVSLTATGPSGSRPAGEYVLEHEFESV
jgi:hypothetical protein